MHAAVQPASVADQTAFRCPQCRVRVSEMCHCRLLRCEERTEMHTRAKPRVRRIRSIANARVYTVRSILRLRCVSFEAKLRVFEHGDSLHRHFPTAICHQVQLWASIEDRAEDEAMPVREIRQHERLHTMVEVCGRHSCASVSNPLSMCRPG